MSPRRFPPPWQIEEMPGGFKVVDVTGQAMSRSDQEGTNTNTEDALAKALEAMKFESSG